MDKELFKDNAHRAKDEFDELKEMSYILVFFIVLFLAIPWLMRYYQKCRYKSYLLSLERGWKLLEEIE